MRLRLAWLERWTWKRTALSLAVVAVTVGGALGASALAGNATAAPAPPKRFDALMGANEDQPRKGFLGIIIAQLNSELAQKLNITQTTGVVVTQVTKDGPADKAGVQRSDVIQKVNGTDIAEVKAVHDAIAAVQPGASVTLVVLRNGQQQ